MSTFRYDSAKNLKPLIKRLQIYSKNNNYKDSFNKLPSTPPNAQNADSSSASTKEHEATKSNNANLHRAEEAATPRLDHGRIPHLEYFEPCQVMP